MSSASYFDLWVCQGRMCRSLGAEELLSQIQRGLAEREADAARVRVLRGGCYGICEAAPNLVVRRWEERDERPDVAADRLTLTEQDNERVYGPVGGEQVPGILHSHLGALGLEAQRVHDTAPALPATRSPARPLPARLPEALLPEALLPEAVASEPASSARQRPVTHIPPQGSVAERIRALRRTRRARLPPDGGRV